MVLGLRPVGNRPAEFEKVRALIDSLDLGSKVVVLKPQ